MGEKRGNRESGKDLRRTRERLERSWEVCRGWRGGGGEDKIRWKEKEERGNVGEWLVVRMDV